MNDMFIFSREKPVVDDLSHNLELHINLINNMTNIVMPEAGPSSDKITFITNEKWLSESIDY